MLGQAETWCYSPQDFLQSHNVNPHHCLKLHESQSKHTEGELVSKNWSAPAFAFFHVNIFLTCSSLPAGQVSFTRTMYHQQHWKRHIRRFRRFHRQKKLITRQTDAFSKSRRQV
jgi:hypothetical protein